jgi:hypothetical protein
MRLKVYSAINNNNSKQTEGDFTFSKFWFIIIIGNKEMTENKIERFFNTAGPIRKEKHYFIEPLSRIDLNHILSLIRQEKYFVLHAPNCVTAAWKEP